MRMKGIRVDLDLLFTIMTGVIGFSTRRNINICPDELTGELLLCLGYILSISLSARHPREQALNLSTYSDGG